MVEPEAARTGSADPAAAGAESADTAADTAAGIAAAVRIALHRPARLGGVRLVAVDGPSGSGKTSLAQPLAVAFAGALGGRVIRPQRFESAREQVAERVSSGESSYLDAATMRRPRIAVVSTDLLATWEHPLDWWPVLEEHLLAPLEIGDVAELPIVEWVSGNPRPGGFVVVPPVEVLVLEGVSSGRRAVADRLSGLIWVEVPSRAERLERAVARDGEAMRPYLVRWQRDEDVHFAADGTRARADVTISR